MSDPLFWLDIPFAAGTKEYAEELAKKLDVDVVVKCIDGWYFVGPVEDEDKK